MQSHLVMLVVCAFLALGCSRNANTSQDATEAPVVDDIPVVYDGPKHPLPPAPMSTSYLTPDIRFSRDKVRDVYIDGRNVTCFPNPHHVYEALVSPSGRYLLVWHLDFPPRKVSIYDLEAQCKVTTFEPGAGGRIRWTAHDLVYHQFGAGTNTAFFTVYSVDGKRKWDGLSSGASLCESGRYLFVYPTLSVTKEEILVADVRNGDVIGRARPDGIACVCEHRWVDGRTVRFWYDGVDDGPVKSVDVSIDPDHPVAWDSVYHVESL